MAMFSVDGLEWDIPCSITRTAELKASQISGILLNRAYFNDVLGTYMQYDIAIAVPFNMRPAYTAIYEKLTEPVDGHEFILPYNQTTLQITARVTNVKDVYVRLAGGGTYWKGIQFTVIANHPTKSMSLSGAISRGMTPLPNDIEAQDGDTYTYNATSGEWEKTSGYQDADNIAY